MDGQHAEVLSPLRALLRPDSARAGKVLFGVLRKHSIDAGRSSAETGVPVLGDLDIACLGCGAPVPHTRRTNAVYCSDECRRASDLRELREERLAAMRHRPPCLGCGGPMPLSFRRTARFCSRACAEKVRYRARVRAAPPKTCIVCGEEFQPCHAPQLYCGRRCQEAAFRAGAPKACEVCGTIIPDPRILQRYCSRRCNNKASKARRARAAGRA